MIKLFQHELYKLWSKRIFVMYFFFLILANVFLIWSFSQPPQFTLPPSAYLKLTNDLKDKSSEQQYDFVLEKYNQIDAITKIDYAVRRYQSDKKEYTRLINGKYKDAFDKYKQVYQNKTYLEYTDDIPSEYLFLDNVKREMEQALGYKSFLEEIRTKYEKLTQISIFNKEDSYSSNNIKTTAQAFEGMYDISINYSPQKGLVTALNFHVSDIILIFVMILISFTLVREEKDNGLTALIRSTARGRFETAFAKMLTLIFSLLFVVLILYGTNLLYCDFAYGLGDLTRTIQSVPYLMRSTLKMNVFEYLCLYMITKWVATAVIGVWILFCMFVAQNMIMGVFFSVAMPIISLIIRCMIPATHKLNVIKYANVISLLQTNEILGTYRNLYWFGNKPIQLNLVEAVAGMLFFSAFAFIFLLAFSKMQIVPTHKKIYNFLSKFKKEKIKPTTVKKQEWYKLLATNGGAILLVFLVLVQGYTTFTSKNYIDVDEKFYAYYMKEVTGKYDTKSYNFLLEKSKKFKPIYLAQNALSAGTISYEEYEKIANSDYALNREYKAFQKVLNHLQYIKENPSAHLLYETGYEKLFGLNDFNKDLNDSIFAAISIILLLSGFMTMEKTSGMKKVIYATPLGGIHTLKAKFEISFILSCIVGTLSLIPRLWQVGMGYGFKGVLSPLMSMSQYIGNPSCILVIGMIVIMIMSRIAACFAISCVVLSISEISNSYILSVMINSAILLFPLILYSMGVDTMKYFCIYPAFHISILFTSGISIIEGIFYLFCFVYIAYVAYIAKELLKYTYLKV